MKPAEIRAELKKHIVWGKPSTLAGGQQVAKVQSDVTLSNSELGFSVTVSINRSQLKNKELALELYNVAVEKFIKGEI